MKRDEVLTQHRQSPGPVMDTFMPAAQRNDLLALFCIQLFEESTGQSTCVEGVQ